MGQKIAYDPADWNDESIDSSAEDSLCVEDSLSADGSFDKFLQEEFDSSGSVVEDENSDSLLLSDSETGYEDFDDIEESVEKLESLSDKQTVFADLETLAAISPEDKAVFNRQLEDLFELLELEQNTDKDAGVKIYQTDSSPSRPWRFH